MKAEKHSLNSQEYAYGVFVKELKNRFLCEVEIDGKVEECYVPSSCHLSNFLQLKGKRVLLVPTQGKSPRTKYALYAMPYKRNYIVLNTSLSNAAVENLRILSFIQNCVNAERKDWDYALLQVACGTMTFLSRKKSP